VVVLDEVLVVVLVVDVFTVVDVVVDEVVVVEGCVVVVVGIIVTVMFARPSAAVPVAVPVEPLEIALTWRTVSHGHWTVML
jgi:class 3 adenylate cyclase